MGSSAWRLAPTLGASVRQREGAGSPLRPASGSTLALFGNSHPSVYSSQAIAGIPPAPARGRGGGGVPRHKLCSLSPSMWPEKGYECDTSRGPRINSTTEKPLPVGSPRAPASALARMLPQTFGLGCLGFFFPNLFYDQETNTSVSLQNVTAESAFMCRLEAQRLLLQTKIQIRSGFENVFGLLTI